MHYVIMNVFPNKSISERILTPHKYDSIARMEEAQDEAALKTHIELEHTQVTQDVALVEHQHVWDVYLEALAFNESRYFLELT